MSENIVKEILSSVFSIDELVDVIGSNDSFRKRLDSLQNLNGRTEEELDGARDKFISDLLKNPSSVPFFSEIVGRYALSDKELQAVIVGFIRNSITALIVGNALKKLAEGSHAFTLTLEERTNVLYGDEQDFIRYEKLSSRLGREYVCAKLMARLFGYKYPENSALFNKNELEPVNLNEVLSDLKAVYSCDEKYYSLLSKRVDFSGLPYVEKIKEFVPEFDESEVTEELAEEEPVEPETPSYYDYYYGKTKPEISESVKAVNTVDEERENALEPVEENTEETPTHEISETVEEVTETEIAEDFKTVEEVENANETVEEIPEPERTVTIEIPQESSEESVEKITKGNKDITAHFAEFLNVDESQLPKSPSLFAIFNKNKYGRLTEYQKYVLTNDVLELKKQYKAHTFFEKLFGTNKAKSEKRLIKDAEYLLIYEYGVNPENLKLK